jgi:hypothetical protein
MEDFRKKKLKKGEKNLWQQLGRDVESESEEIQEEPQQEDEENNKKYKLLRSFLKKK